MSLQGTFTAEEQTLDQRKRTPESDSKSVTPTKTASVGEEVSADVQIGTDGKFAFNFTELPSLTTLNKVKDNPPPYSAAIMSGQDNRAFDNGSDTLAGTTVTVAPIAPEGQAKEASPEKFSPEDKKKLTLGIMKNVVVISVAFTFLFTAYNAMANLQSSINQELGTTSLAVLYASLVVSCAFVPTLLISTLKVKHTIAVSMLGYSAYMAAQFYPEYYTMIPGAILLGLGAAPMWSAKCTYLTEVGRIYAEYTNQNTEVVVTRMFGVFFLFFQSSQVWGNLISSAVLSVDADLVDPDDAEFCGINYCANEEHNISSSANVTEISDSKLYTLSGIYLGCALLSSLIILFLVDPLSRFGDYESKKGDVSLKDGVVLLGATFRHLMHPYQLLIVPLTIWSGVEQAFIQGDFTSAFISCGLGVHMVGYVMICYGVFDALCSISFSPIVKLVGRIPVFLFGCAANVSIIILFMVWEPNSDDIIIFFVAAAVWGIADAVWQTQINAFYGVIFPGEAEAAFSNYRMWESVGFIITFVTNSTICITTKLYIVIGFLTLGMAGYLTIEVLEHYKVLKRGEDGQPLKVTQLCK